MSKLKEMGPVRMLLLLAALLTANLYVGEQASWLEAQDALPGPGFGFLCVGPQGSSQNWCESHPTAYCDLAECTGDTLEP